MSYRALTNSAENSQEIASELNNLLQIIAGTSSAIENIWEGRPDAARYFTMLRESIARAADVTTELVKQSGRLADKGALPAEFVRAKPPAIVSQPARKDRIMLVDDEKMLLILTSEILKDAGYEVVTAQSGFECLDHFGKNSELFDLVLLDLNMPLMDGEETFQRLRAMQPDLRVMLCTGYVQQERLNHMLDEGLNGFLPKPLAARDYLERVRSVLAESVA